MKRFLQWLALPDGDRIVRIKSLWPSIGQYGIEWPTLLIDRRGAQRMTVTPVWDWLRVRMLFGYVPPPPAPRQASTATFDGPAGNR